MEINFIPIDLYTPLWYNTILFISLLIVFSLQVHNRGQVKYYRTMSSIWGYPILLFSILYIGLRPVHEIFTDMRTYAYLFDMAKGNTFMEVNTLFKDFGFFYFTKCFSAINSSKTVWFLACACLYIFPLYLVTKRWFGNNYWLLAFVAILCSFSFWAYGTNTIRTGIAASLFLLGISSNKRIFNAIWLLGAFSFHASMILPIIGYVISLFYHKPKIFVIIWAICIPLSIILGGLPQEWLVGLVSDDRSNYFFTGNIGDYAFRWDFILYSASGILSIIYFIYRHRFKDKTYDRVAVTYLSTNALWILINQISFSDRFAYLSWFLLPFVIVYPWIKGDFKFKKFSFVLLLYSAFTYTMFLIK